jgi:maltose alpha-D-glucosyltransferase/alpha-amylase
MGTANNDVATIRLPGAWEAVLEGASRETLEREVLPRYLPAQRWFGGKARQIATARFVDWAPLTVGGKVPTFLALVRLDFAGGGDDLYFLPLAVTAGTAPDVPPELRVARLTGPRGEAVLHDALADQTVCQALLSAIGHGNAIALRGGSMRGVATAAFGELRGDAGRPLPAKLGPATSSNSLVFFDERLLLKLFRRLQAGINPDFEIGRFLTEHHQFERIPKVAGALEYRPRGGVFTLAILQQSVPNQGDGWQHALGELAQYFERAAAQPSAPTESAELIGPYLEAAGLLGRRTAEMHLALASDDHDMAFAPEPLTARDLAGVVDDVCFQAGQATAILRATGDRLPEAIRPEVGQLRDETPGLLEQLGTEAEPAPGAAKIRCHGDYHLGQVLWADGDFILIDFEGEPTRTVEERRAKQSPLKDVAGMLRSLDYAAHAGLFAFTKDRPADLQRLEPWAGLWQRWTSAAFLREYLATAGRASLLPSGPGQAEALLRRFMLAKAFYELVYELNNRPDWVRIPLRGLLALVAQEANVMKTAEER